MNINFEVQGQWKVFLKAEPPPPQKNKQNF